MATDEKRRIHADRMVAKALQDRKVREQGYREQALKIYPWICGRCTREFTRENVQQLTVHHRDHNHENNPKDGSNWELLCIYCHDNEHSRVHDAHAEHRTGIKIGSNKKTPATSSPFANLKELLGQKKS